MTTQAQDLWGDIQVDSTPTPSMILKQQAALLGEKTKHALEAEVRTWVDADRFVHSFLLVVPTLDNYTYQLFKVEHDADLYPVTPSDRYIPGAHDPLLRSEDDFKQWIQKKLSSPETKRVVANLLSMARS